MAIWSPREFNAVADHLVNAALDTQSDWCHIDDVAIQQHLLSRGSFRICVDGGVRKRALSSDQRCAAMGGALFAVNMGETPMVLVASAAQTIESVASAFQAEAMALDWLLSIFCKTTQNMYTPHV